MEITSGEVELGHLAVSSVGGPGIVVVHDVWGLYDHFRDVANRLAAHGYVVLALDAYRNLEGRPSPGDPGAWMRELPDGSVLADIQRAVDFLKGHPAVGDHGIGVVGFCMGGSYAVLSSAFLERIEAAVAFYGVLSYDTGLYASESRLDPKKKPCAPLDAARALKVPVTAFFGDEDVYVSLADIHEFSRRAVAAAPASTVRVYPGAGHAFANDTRPAAYRPEAAQDAWQRMLAFLDEQLRLGKPPG